VAFVVFGSLLAVRWPRVVWMHLPATAWGVLIELTGWICPLTPLENYLRKRGGSSTYQSEFIEQYLLPILYPARLTRGRQILLAILAIAVNLCLYAYIIQRARRIDEL